MRIKKVEFSVKSARKIHFGFGRRFIAACLGCVALALRLADPWRQRPGQKVLILEPYGMGDVLSLQPLVRRLAKAGYTVTVCGREMWRGLLPGAWVSGWVDACVPWTGYSLREKYGRILSVVLGFVRQVRALKTAATGAVGLDVRGDVRSVILLRASGCRRIISFSNYLGTDLKLLPGVAERVSVPDNLRRWELNLLMAKAMDLAATTDEPPPSLTLLVGPSHAEPSLDVGLVPIAPWAGKEWPPGRWLQLAERLKEGGYHPIALCGPGQESSLARAVGPDCERRQCTSIEDWIRVLPSLRAVVTVDTGPMHLAGALCTPVVALMGSTVLPLWAPSGGVARVLEHQVEVDCSPCHQVGDCPFGLCKGMELITVDEVLHALSDVVGQPRTVNENRGGECP